MGMVCKSGKGLEIEIHTHTHGGVGVILETRILTLLCSRAAHIVPSLTNGHALALGTLQLQATRNHSPAIRVLCSEQLQAQETKLFCSEQL